MKNHPKTTTEYILWSLIPYTEPNLKLTFKPSAFFYDLEKISRKNHQTIKNAYYKAQRDGLIVFDDDGMPRLTDKAKRKAKLFKPEKLKDAVLVVMFDVPEEEKNKRQRLRLLLKELSFKQIQKSVWTCEYDYREYVRSEIKDQELQDYVLFYEARQIQ